MIKLENTEVIGWEPTIRGMRNPMNSWAKSDSYMNYCECCSSDMDCIKCFGRNGDMVPVIGPNDHDLMMRLSKAGSVDGKFMRMIAVYVDITAPLYWWKEFDTYKVGTVANSCSTMHKIHAKEFVLDDFSYEHLNPRSLLKFQEIIDELNFWRGIYLDGGFEDMNSGIARVYGTRDKDAWWQMIQLLPSSYNQRRTIMLNYEVLAGIYPKRRDHKLDEWHKFCDWIEELPYSDIITERSAKKNIVLADESHPAPAKDESYMVCHQPEPEPTHISYHDRLVISAYTGYLMADFDDVHKFIEETLGRPVLTHELASDITKELQEKLEDEFVNICKAALDRED